MGCCITSHLDFDKGGCVTQVEWINVLCDNCQAIIVYRSEMSVSNIPEADSCG